MADQHNPTPDSSRRLRQADRLGRVLRVLELIQGRGKWNAKTIARELEVSERTVYRDLQALEFAGVPWYYDHQAHCYRIRSDYRFPVPNLDRDEAFGLAVAAILSQAEGLNVAGTARAAVRKVAAVSGEETAQILNDADRLVSVFNLQLAGAERCRDMVRCVQEALAEKRQLAGRYRSPYEVGPVDLRLTPIRICLIKRAWYLIAVPEGESAPRTYRVSRFLSFRKADEPANIPEHFDLRDYLGNAWAVFRGSETFDVRIRFLPQSAPIVTETHWHPTQQADWQADGSVILSFRVDGLEEIRNWLLRWSSEAVILEPEELRRLLSEKLEAGLALNCKKI